MKRLYYDCPAQALYMMKEFGIKLQIQNQGVIGRYFSEISLEEVRINFLTEKMFVAPESEHIFEPKEGDLGIDSEHDYIIGNYEAEYKEWNVPYEYSFKQGIIIMRDNKHFFAPKIETDK